MNKRQRKILSECCSLCNDLGSPLDGSATNVRKYIDRQMAHMEVYQILYGALVDDPENDQRDFDFDLAEKALVRLKEIAGRQYKDRNGN
jgi:hypothetical protein